MPHQHHATQTKSLRERLCEFVADARTKAEELPDGPERDALVKKIKQVDNAISMDEWTSSSELQPPK